MAADETGRDVEESLLGEALTHSEVAVAVLRGTGLLLEYANLAHQQLFGWPAGSGLAQVRPSGGPLLAAAGKALAGQPTRVDELPAAGGRMVSVMCSPAGGEGEAPGVLLVAVDTTEQVRARQRAEDHSERLAVLDHATAAVTTADADPRRELLALAGSIVPSLADACAVYLVDPPPPGRGRSSGLRATRLACVIDPVLGVAPPPPEIRLRLADSRAVFRAATGGETVLAREVESPESSWGERWLDALAPHSVVAVPLGSPEVVAVVKLVATERRPPYQASDVALIREITGRADVAVGRALRLQHANEIALTLQRGVLSDPAELDWLEIAVRYRPAVPELEVCGDWYDALLLPTGSLALTVGDVVGHDLYAVSSMSQLRSMVQALACQPGAEPAGVLSALDRLSRHLAIGNLATVVHGHLERSADPAGAMLTWANAGHPPPLLVAPDGVVTVLDQASSPLLGLTEHTGQQHRRFIPPGGLLLCYTDGLIEDPERPSDDPIAELVKAVGARPGASPEELCDQLIAAAPAADDIALLAVRVRA